MNSWSIGQFLAQTTLSTQPASQPATQPLDAPTTQPNQPLEEIKQLFQQLDLNETFTRTTWIGWGILLAGLFLGVAGGKLVQTILRTVGNRLRERGWLIRGTAILSMAGPAYLAVFATGLSMGLAPIVLSASVKIWRTRIVELLYIIAIAWLLWGLVELIELMLRQLSSKTGSKLDQQVVPLIRKTLRLFLLIVFVLFTAQTVFDANITAWLAGLGIAGLAVSLAAQDSIKNFFGSLTIFMDRPFAVGEAVKVDVHEGIVEEIGFRSTRLRTPEGNMVTIPNSKIVDNYVENLGRRARIRRVLNITLPADTPPEKAEEALAVIKRVLAEPNIAAELDTADFAPIVALDEITNDGLNIHVTYWVKSTDQPAYLGHSEKFNLRLLRALNEAGIKRK